MATFWKSDPIASTTMDDDASRKPAARRATNFHRPQIYVHVEFGMSWSHGRPPNHHERTYRSKGLRERGAYFPRHVPPPNTNYLEPGPDGNELQAVYRSQQENRQQHQQQHQQRSIPIQRNDNARQNDDDGSDERRSREDRSSSVHSRGRSAPPPINDSPWDVTAQAHFQGPYHAQLAQRLAADTGSGTPPPVQVALALPMGAQGVQPQARTVSAGSESLWKRLPEPPTSYRLGEEGMPWDALSWPAGYEPEADPEHAAAGSSYPGEHRIRRPAQNPGAGSSVAAHATYVPYTPVANIHVTSPQQTPPPVHRRDPPASRGVPGEGRDLSALSVAMMTVDNGFENQWWNQGPREHTAIVRTMPNTPVAGGGIDPAAGGAATPQDQWFVSPESARAQPHFQDFSAASLGWAVATPPAPRQLPHLQSLNTQSQPSRASHAGSFSTASIVSPMTPPDYARLGRTLSTRSEEAYITGGRYA